MLEVPKLIFGLIIALVLAIIYLVGSLAGMWGEDESISDLIAMFGNAYAGGRESRPATRKAGRELDFPIKDRELKAAYTEAFKKAYESNTAGERPAPVVKYSDLRDKLKYTESGHDVYTGAFHIGQRKLILNEIQFLTRVPVGERSVVVYAGAAPSHKGAFLASLFRDLKFILVDPAPFEIRPFEDITIEHLPPQVTDGDVGECVSRMFGSVANICTARMYMSPQLSAALRSQFDSQTTYKSLYFVSDIRTNMTESAPTTLDIMWNSAQHADWISKMKPTLSMLKFRLPFYNETDDELRKFESQTYEPPYKEAFDNAAEFIDFRKLMVERKFSYYCGEIFIQPWAPVSSTEQRLIVGDGVGSGGNGVKATPGQEICEYELHEYEDTMFHYNKILRNFKLYHNPHADRRLGFDYCNDCALENQIWTDYIRTRQPDISPGELRAAVHSYVETLSGLTFRPLTKHDYHGKLFSKPSIDELLARMAGYKKKERKVFVKRGGRGRADDDDSDSDSDDAAPTSQ